MAADDTVTSDEGLTVDIRADTGAFQREIAETERLARG
ncbi:MAG: phage tail tape measure protein, partial [Starkeya sp.]|nr:phage tail tape measure protein [Starkeya sp.]